LRIALVTLVIFSFSLPIIASASPVPIDVGETFVHGFPDGGLFWLSTEREGIFLVDSSTGGVERLVEGAGIPRNRTTCGIAALGRAWLGSSDGLFYLEEGNWFQVDHANLPNPSINCLAAMGEEVWVGTRSGIAVYDSNQGSWSKVTVDDGLGDGNVLSIDLEEESAWIGTIRGGVSHLDRRTGSWRRWTRDEGLVSNTVFTVEASPEHVFAGTTNGLGVLNRETGEWASYGVESLPSGAIYSLMWDGELDSCWVGTGSGISRFTPSNGSFETTTKVGEVELEKVNGIFQSGGVVWFLRASNQWYSHRTTGIVGYCGENSSWIRPIHLDLLIDQSGYGPGHSKVFMVQSNEPLEGGGTFSVLNMAGQPIYSGKLGERFDRADWDAYYWEGSFTDLQRRGNFTIQVEIGKHVSTSPVFEVDNDVLIDECGELIYEFLRYMRCGVSHRYRPKALHLDDGILPNGTHIDATGGWHCAGIWGGKWTSYHTYVLFNILFAREMRPDFYETIDDDQNGLPDIVDEAAWGCEYLLKMQLENGTIYQEVEKVEETDNIIGTPDDRKIFGWMSNYNGLLAVAGWAETARLVRDLNPELASQFMDGALLSFGHYGSLLAEGSRNSIEAAAMTIACVQLYRYTENRTYLDLAERYCGEALDLPFASYRGSFVPVALGYYSMLNPGTGWMDGIVDYIRDIADQQVAQWTSPDNVHRPFDIPTWYLYLMDPWSAEVLLAYHLTGNQSYLDHALFLVDCHLGVNPYRICFLEGTGSISPPAYTSSFVSPSNPRGAVPGSIPQGIQFKFDRPYYDMSMSPGYSSGETWLINTNFIQTISLIPRDDDYYPLEVAEGSWIMALILVFTVAGHQVVRQRQISVTTHG